MVNHEQGTAAVIGRLDRRGRLLWSLPKGHIEAGETAEQTAVREVAEETGIIGAWSPRSARSTSGSSPRAAGCTRPCTTSCCSALGGELSDADVEVTEVAWVPLDELESRLAYADERRLVRRRDRAAGATTA